MTWLWVAGIFLALGVFVVALLPLLGKSAAADAQKFLQRRKNELADDLTALAAKKSSGELSAEDYEAQRRALETAALAIIEDEKHAAAPPTIAGLADRVRLRAALAAIAFLLAADMVAGIYLLKGGWRHLVVSNEAASSAGENDSGMPDPAAMVARLEKRLAKNPDDPRGQALLGRSYLVMERYAEAVSAYRKAVELDPAVLEYQVGLGVAQLRTGDTVAAQKTFDRVLAENPEQPDALWFTAMIQIHDRQIEKAKVTFKRLLEATPPAQRPEVQQQIEQVLQMLIKK